LHMDFLFMGSGIEGKNYLLIMRDDLSSYIWLWPTEDCTAASAAEALCVWIGVFGAMTWLISDQGSHFKNNLIKELVSELRTKHHFTTAYSPWANGSVERICREVLRATKALISEWKLSPKEWPAVTEAVQGVLNQSPTPTLGLRNKDAKGVYRTPLEVFSGIKPIRPLIRALPVEKYVEVSTKDEARARALVGVEELQEAIRNMHQEVKGLTSASRKRHVDRHNRRTNVHGTGFAKGDFVLAMSTEGRP